MNTWKNYDELVKKYPELPSYMIDSIVQYRDHGQYVGGFLTSLLSNDLMNAFSRADEINQAHISLWAKLLVNDMPMGSYGNHERYLSWCQSGGLEQRK